MDWQTLWNWLSDANNRDTLGFIGAGLAAVVAGLWALYKYSSSRPPVQVPEPPVASSREAPVAALAPAPPPASPALPPADPTALRMSYLQLMAAEWSALPLEVLDPKASAVDTATRRLTLEQVYVSLDTNTPRPESLKPKKEAWEPQPPLSAVEALGHAEPPRIVLLGQPGAGKSTFGRYLCLNQIEALRHPGEARLADRLPGWTGPALLPVFAPLRQYAAELAQATAAGAALALADFIARRVDDRAPGYGARLRQELHDQGGLVVFDGLDEVAGDLRQPVKQALLDFAAGFHRCRLLLTCRVHSYRQDTAWQLPWADHTLAEFSRAKIEEFIAAWYRALAALNPHSAIDYPGKQRTLTTALDPSDPRRLGELAGTPLLLTIMAIVHTYKELPDSRVGVYRECVDLLLLRWQGARVGQVQRPPLLDALRPHGVTVQKLQQGLRELAYEAHKSGDQGRGSGGRALVSDVIVRGAMTKWLGEGGAREFLDYCRQANGLLLTERVVEREEGITEALYVFPHLSFEEYLAALYLLQLPAAGLAEAVKRAGDAAWWEVARFYGEYLCHDEQGANPYQAKALVEQLCPASAPTGDPDWRRVRLAGALLPGWLRETPASDHDARLTGRVANHLADLLQTPTALQGDPPARANAGRDLAALGDPRPGVGRDPKGFPNLRWVRIPGTAAVAASGRFPAFSGLRLGTGARPDPEASNDEKWPISAPPLAITDFELAAYPVTVAQFRPFVEQGGYGEVRYWSEAGRQWRDELQQTQPDFWDDPTWTLDNHPVVGVVWYEAEAYSHWLNEQWGLPPGTLRLLTEAEWAWAARGPEGRRYPWGDEWASWRCNSQESGISRTSAVGCFSGGAADWWRALQPESEAVHDLAGNVWEWTASVYTKDYGGPHQPVLNVDAGGPRVLRGGSWSYVPRRLRAAYRYWGDPDARYGSRGFRLARTFPF